MTRHTLSLYSPTGTFLAFLDAWTSIDVTLTEREPSPMTVALLPAYRDDLLQRDCRIVYERAPDGVAYGAGNIVGDTAWLLTGREHMLDDAGQHRIILTCDHPTSLFSRRVIAYHEGTSQAHKTDLVSDALYDFINEQFVAATDTARNISSAHFVLDTIGTSFGPTVAMDASYQTLADVLQNLTQQASAQGTYTAFEIYTPTPPGPFHARVYRVLRGADRTNTVRLGLGTANFSAASVREDWSSAVSFVYGGGAGKKDERLLATVEDTTLSTQSPFGRYEHFLSTSANDQSTLNSETYRALRDYRPRRVFEASINAAAPGDYTYGVQYTWGDLVTGTFQAPNFVIGTFEGSVLSGPGGWTEFAFPCRVNPVHLQAARLFDASDPRSTTAIGVSETIEVHLQSVDSA